MKIKPIQLGAGLGLVVALGAAYWVQRGGSALQPPVRSEHQAPSPIAAAGPAAVEVARVELLRLQDATQAVGAVRAKQSVMLRPETSGRVVALGFADGQRVRRGQLLVQLDDSVPRAQALQARAQEAIARTNLQRQRELAAQNFVSTSAVDQSAAALEVAQSQVALAQAQVQRMRITAPFDGVAGIRVVHVGDYVKDGADLVALEDRSAMLVDFRLPESGLAQLRLGLMAQVVLDALPGRELQARVEAIDAQLEANGRSVLVRARLLDAPRAELRSGMFARVRLVFSVREKALVVPEEALVPLNGKQYVVRLVPAASAAAAKASAPDGVSQRVPVSVGLRLPGKAEVLSGLSAGDVVVTAGQARLLRADGQAVRVVQVGAGAAPLGASAPVALASGVSTSTAPASGVAFTASAASTR